MQEAALLIGLKKILQLQKLKILFHGDMLLVILMVKKLLEDFMKKIEKNNQKKFRIVV